ncbi:glutaminase [Streptomyces tateyamensis]|uniref:Glutaminase n=1 Tax=Streptomyces tateyamensis TaxID=565073 RepID=A0A2V4N524_9ACTN|nr:glutaminase [Streptomyces tateyamensis]PYC76646.1 glutaminase [Streptomyces tateyamensis]
MDDRDLFERITRAVRPALAQGRVASYIPALAAVDPRRFGLAIADTDSRTVPRGTGDWQVPFSIQSLSKVFTLALVLAADGERLWSRVGKEPSGAAFNSLAQLEREQGIPRNPFVNAGALVVTDRLLTLTGDDRGTLRDFLRAESGNPRIDFDAEVAWSESRHGHRNAALAHLLADHGRLDNPVPDVLDHYFWQCSLAMNCRDLALAAGFLARHGLRADSTRLLTSSEAKRVNAVMLIGGTYDAAGEFAHRVGLPAKSGVGGGIIAVIPGRCTLCTWGPALDAHGNSIAGITALDTLTTVTGWSIF